MMNYFCSTLLTSYDAFGILRQMLDDRHRKTSYTADKGGDNMTIQQIQQYTIKEAAKLLAVSERVLRNLCICGEIKAYKLNTSWRIPAENLETFLTQRQGAR